MTGRSEAGEARTDAVLSLAATHGAGLHHLAAMLTGGTDSATALVARTLLAADESTAAARQLRVDLVRLYLRTAPRRRERAEPSRARDAGDVLRMLRPRARAASALRLVEDWDTASVARAVGVRPHRVDALVPTTPGLAVALAAVADQHVLTGADLDSELRDELREAAPSPSGGDRRRRWLVAAAVPLAVLVGWAAVTGGQGGDEDLSAVTAGVDDGPRTDLSGVGWELDEDGDPPRAAMGLVRTSVATVTDGAWQEVSWPSPVSSIASFGVLWCDMPPAQDANLEVPSGTITVGGEEVRLPCAGRDGSPPVTRVVPLPPSGSGRIQLEGDLPPGGGATLAVYEEDTTLDVPLPRGSLVDAPPVQRGSVVLDPADTVPAPSYGMERSVLRPAAVEVGHDSTVRVWVGRTGAVTVMVDGQPATDDGDYRTLQGLAEQEGPGEEPDAPPWREQRPDLRWGRWLAWVPGEVRTFDLPEGVRPGPGERDTVTVQVMTWSVQEHVQVAVLDATRTEVDTTPVRPEAAPAVPAWVGGHRLVGAWRLPLDGHPRELLGAVPATGRLVPVGLVLDRDLMVTQLMGAPGVLERDGEAVELWYDSDLARTVETLEGGWAQPLPPGDGPLRAAAPATHGGGEGLLLLYEPVSYEDYDFSSGGVPPGSWRVGDDPPSDSRYSGVEPFAVVGPEDLEDGTATVLLPDSNPIAARVTTEGGGRIRFEIGGYAADNLWSSRGWWSSWTDEPVVTEVDLSFSEGMGERELTLEVEDYEEFTVEVLAPGHGGP